MNLYIHTYTLFSSIFSFRVYLTDFILKIIVLNILCSLSILDSGVRRLIIVEAGSKRVEGVISLSDIFKFFLG